MVLDPPGPIPGGLGGDEYLLEYLRDAFVTDDRTHELGVHVSMEGGKIVLRGTVSTPSLRRALGEVAQELVPQAEIVNDIEVTSNAEPDGVEELGGSSP